MSRFPGAFRAALVAVSMLWACLDASAQALPPLDSRLPVDPVVSVGTLSNGLKYYVRRNARPEHRVQLRLAVKTGSVFEDDDQRGLAHMLEHMAFNGTDHFEPGEMVSYFETAGARFGAHVNAYTSFDQTVYMLQVATDKPGLVDKGLLALSDFAGGMTLDPKEIDKERGVVIEEWRLRQGAGSRLMDKQAPVLFYHSRYAERLPIGTPEILRTFTPARLRDFYNTWYRPDRMAVVVVGDIDPKQIVAAIEMTFRRLSPKGPAASEPQRELPPHPETLVSIVSDPEAQASTVSVLRTYPTPPQGRVSDYRRDLVRQLMFQMLNVRFGEMARRADAPFLGAAASQQPVTALTSAVSLGARVEDGKIEPGLRAVILEARRAREFGFSPSEFEQTRRRVLAGYEQAVAEREKTDSGNYAAEYIRNFTTDEPFPGIQMEYDLTRALLPGITQDEVSEVARDLLAEDNRAVLVAAPDKAAAPLPAEAALRQVLSEATAATVEPWRSATSRAELLPVKPAAGRVVSRRTLDSIGVTVLKLSNGVEVWLKPTDFKNDQVLLSAYARGGTSTSTDATYFDTALSASLVNLAGVGGMPPPEISTLLAGKVVNVSPFIDTSVHGVRGGSRPQDLEAAFQMLYLTFTAPNGDQASLDLLKRQLNSLIANRQQNPAAVFADRVRALNTGNSRYVRPITPEALASLKLDVMRQAYRERFANAADFTFFIVGTFKEADLVPQLERYVASLPSSGKHDGRSRPLGFRFPAGIEKIRIEKGREPKSEILTTYFADAGDDEDQALLANAATDVLEIRLRDLLREALGSTYSVSVTFNSGLPERGYGTISIDFGSAPENAEKLAGNVLTEVDRLRTEGPTAEECAKVREQSRQSLETASKQNGYWLSVMQSNHVMGRQPEAVAVRRERIERITPAAVQAAARKYFPASRYTVAILMPETSGGAAGTAPAPAPRP
jgi:zinc protease